MPYGWIQLYNRILSIGNKYSEHVFLYFTPSFFVLDGKWRHQQSMRITVLLRTELVRYIEKKIHCSFISHGIFHVKCTWIRREQNIICEINVKWTWHENRICVFAFSEWLSLQKNPHQQIVYQYWIKHGVVLIVFPAGILQPPYYHKDYPRSAPWIKYRGESKLKFLVACF